LARLINSVLVTPNRPPRYVYFMGQSERPTCPHCRAYLTWALPQGGNGKRTFQCLNCDGPDPMKTEKTTGWLKGELQPPK
jgi:hypothetical protein